MYTYTSIMDVLKLEFQSTSIYASIFFFANFRLYGELERRSVSNKTDWNVKRKGNLNTSCPQYFIFTISSPPALVVANIARSPFNLFIADVVADIFIRN